MIRKLAALTTLIGFCFVLSSCSIISLDRKGGTKEYDPHYSDQAEDRVYNEEALKEILRCFDERDAEAIKNMFSPYKQSINNLDAQIERAFSAYEGTSISYEGFFDFGYMTEEVRDGKLVEKTVGAKMLGIKTGTGKTYVISFGKCIVNDDDESQLGVTSIELREEDDRFLEAIGDDRYYDLQIVG